MPSGVAETCHLMTETSQSSGHWILWLVIVLCFDRQGDGEESFILGMSGGRMCFLSMLCIEQVS